MYRNKAVSALHKLIERGKLLWRNLPVIRIEENGVEFLKVLCVQRIHSCGILKVHTLRIKRLTQNWIIEVTIMMGTRMSEEKNMETTGVRIRAAGLTHQSTKDKKYG